jgi:hypothetical protein
MLLGWSRPVASGGWPKQLLTSSQFQLLSLSRCAKEFYATRFARKLFL